MIGGKIGLWEILLILAVALIVFGPAKLPELGRSIGNGLREFRKATSELKDSISLEDSETDKKS
jgi:sec-independent protein translocase protein TatA